MAYDPFWPKAISTLTEVQRQWRGNTARVFGAQSLFAAASAWTAFVSAGGLAPAYLMITGADAWFDVSRLTVNLLTPAETEWAFKPANGDRRFRYASWRRQPFSGFAQAYLAAESLWRRLVVGMPGLKRLEARRVEYLGHFVLNALAPVNFATTNPEIIETFLATRGESAVDGLLNLAEDMSRLASHEHLPELDQFIPGRTVALEPGSVVYRDHLFELIQYASSTQSVWRQPILIVPAWLMRFYVLDLGTQDSFVGFLVEHGFTVFLISWKNPDATMADIGLDAYRKSVMSAINAIGDIVPGQQIHLAGYCLGGTIAAIAAAAMKKIQDDRLASLSLLATQTDFTEVGDMMLFVDDCQVRLLEDLMHVQGFLDAKQMASAFYALRANEMIFARLVERYLLGRKVAPMDIDAWLSDPTRIPERAHRDYLHNFFLENGFANGTFEIDGQAVGLADIQVPAFLLGAERDHVVPWRSVFRTAFKVAGPATFILTGGGHNSGIVSPPGKPKASFRRLTRPPAMSEVDPEVWADQVPIVSGSWWPAWVDWLRSHGVPEQVRPPPLGNIGRGYAPLEPAPGRYVREP